MFSKNDSGKKRVLGSIAQGAVAAALVASLGPVAGVVAPTLANTAFGEETTTQTSNTEANTTENKNITENKTAETKASDTKAEAKTVATYDAATNKIGTAEGARDGAVAEFISHISKVSVKLDGSDAEATEYTPAQARIINDYSVDLNAKVGGQKVFANDGTYTLVVTSSDEYKPLTFDITVTDGELTVPVYRLYNKYDYLRLYTTSKDEYDHLVSIGWNGEKIGWQSPTDEGSDPVYRLYNKYNGEHLYTTNKSEYDHLVSIGWNGEDIAFYSTKADDAKKDTTKKYVPVNRYYNKYITGIGSTHHYTLDPNEQSTMVADGWQDEGVAFYAIQSVKKDDAAKAETPKSDEAKEAPTETEQPDNTTPIEQPKKDDGKAENDNTEKNETPAAGQNDNTTSTDAQSGNSDAAK